MVVYDSSPSFITTDANYRNNDFCGTLVALGTKLISVSVHVAVCGRFVTHPQFVKIPLGHASPNRLDDGGSERAAGASRAEEPAAPPRVARVSPILCTKFSKFRRLGSDKSGRIKVPRWRGGGGTQ